MQGLEKLTAPRNLCLDLVQLRVKPNAHFWHYFDGEGWDVVMLKNPVFDPEKIIPAWTKEELDFMVGNEWPKPDLMGTYRQPEGFELDVYCIYFPDKMLQYKTGSEASADGLKWLLVNGKLDVKKLNDRFEKRFSNRPPTSKAVKVGDKK